ncbi:MAG TPA: UDP-N-acetylmuramoyl-tripeptide--D-alanyl-D-alanine ligase [Prolixibacteraceae bacterium]|nr:UDP-N-acetylmuramoyl-tripeptide--D-alanyl-D-alanine ligase [Prolixibacteraceae bacterium]
MTTDQIYNLFLKHPEVITDSRNIKPGGIFFALKGANFNGNEFAAEAIKKGAAFAVVDEKSVLTNEKIILVDDVLKTLQDLAQAHRKKLVLPIVAITGSNGKTTTKELIAEVLAKKFNISFTQGNLNNHIGVPLTLLKMNANTAFGIVEMGANHPGEIADLCKIADPDYGIITNIGKAHLEGFGSFEGVKKTKAELYNHLAQKNGIVFYNNDNTILKDLTKNIQNKVSYGTQNADLTAAPVSSPPFVHIKANFPKGVLYLNTNLTGDYNIENVIAAACVGNYFEVDPLKIQEALKNYRPSNNRSQLIEKGNVKIIMDAYNANPTSMHASIKSFLAGFPAEKSYLILGDMLELGKYEIDEHHNLLSEIGKYPLKNIFLTGPIFTKAAKNLPFKTFRNIGSLCSYFKAHPLTEGAVLVKGSRGIGLEKVVECIN